MLDPRIIEQGPGLGDERPLANRNPAARAGIGQECVRSGSFIHLHSERFYTDAARPSDHRATHGRGQSAESRSRVSTNR
jgi:hypothetical protein